MRAIGTMENGLGVGFTSGLRIIKSTMEIGKMVRCMDLQSFITRMDDRFRGNLSTGD